MPTKNLVSDFGGVGDAQRVTVNITVASGLPTLTVGTGIFVSGDATKTISIWDGSNFKTATISSFTSSTVVTLNSNFTWNSTASSADVLWGTDNTNALIGVSGSWRAYAITQTNTSDIPILQVPDGNYAYHADPSQGLSVGVLNSTKITGLSGVAANCKLMQFDNSEMRFGTNPAIVPNRGYNTTVSGANSVRLQTASGGATTSTVVNFGTTAADGSTFGSRVVVGRVCLLAAYDMQGTYESFFGYPPNSFFFEWNVITAYNAGTGLVTFQNPLTQGYSSLYPRWGVEDTQFGSDQGGPFTMWVAPDGYNNTVTLENMTIDSPHNQCATHMRYQVLNNLVMNGPGLYPTQNDVVTISNSVYPQSLEIDKMTNEVIWNNCTLNIIQQQSASPNKMTFNGGTINHMECCKYTTANGVTFTGVGRIICGVSGYGRCNRIELNNCTGISILQQGGGSTDDLNGTSGTGSQANASDYYTFVGGVIRILKSDNKNPVPGSGNFGQQNLTRLFPPGGWINFDQKYFDQVEDVYEDGTYAYVKFKNTTDWPFTPVLRMGAHSCPDFSMTNCTGTAPELEDWNQALKRIPLYSYSKRTYTADGTGTTVKAIPYMLGKLITAKYNVTTPGSVTFHQSQFDNWFTNKTDYTSYTYSPTIACINGGLRTVRGGTTATGAQGSDSIPDLTSVGQIWMRGGSSSGPQFSANGSNAVITVEINTDQGIPPIVTAMMPLFGRLRIHS